MKIHNKLVTITLIALASMSLQANQTKQIKVSDSQKELLNIAYKIGKMFKANDGETFGKSLATIALTESSAGVNIVGDIKKKNIDLMKCSLGPFQIQPNTARRFIKSDKFLNKKFSYLLKDDKKLINMLLTKPRFGALIAGTHFKYFYNISLKRGYKRGPLFGGFSTYNGGWQNEVYYKRSMKNMRLVNKLIKQGTIKLYEENEI